MIEFYVSSVKNEQKEEKAFIRNCKLNRRENMKKERRNASQQCDIEKKPSSKRCL